MTTQSIIILAIIFTIIFLFVRSNTCNISDILFKLSMLELEKKKLLGERKTKILIKRHTTDIPLPTITEKGDWVDLYAAEDVELKKDESKIISLGISVELEKGYGAILAPRSSTFKKYGVTVTNSIGIIDNTYCGENDIWGLCVLAHRDTVIHKGDRIAQFMIYETTMHDVKISEVSEMYSGDRGGFGSTGSR